MIRVEPTTEPDGFDDRCRQPGRRWLEAHPVDPQAPSTRPPSYWTDFNRALHAAFHERCGYLGVWISRGSVDHFASWAGNPRLAYEWSNYRYADTAVNSAKKPAWDGHILDPFEVDDAWFEVVLPACTLRIVEAAVPEHLLQRVRFTVEKLRLDYGEDVVEQRRIWLRMHEEEGLSLEELRRKAPQVAAAVERRHATPPP